MSRIIIGIDPDANLHGVAIFVDGQLQALRKMMLPEIMCYIQEVRRDNEIFVSMENVLHTNAVFPEHAQKNMRKHAKVANNIGRCQQSCIELVRLFTYLEVPHQLVRPTAGNWAHNKSLFEKATGWKGTSNEDTRSAAYFGFMMAGMVTRANY